MQTLSQSPPSLPFSRIMARSTTHSKGLLVWSLVVAFISQNIVFHVYSASSSTFEDQKNFYFPPLIPGLGTPSIIPGVGSPSIIPGVGSPPIDPSVGSPPIDPGVGSPPVTLTPPIVPSPPIVYHTSPPPTYGSGGSTPPVHHTPPSHSGGGGGHHHGRSPPANCGSPKPRSPPRHVDPGHHNPSPAPPTYHYNPPSSGGGTPTPTVPSSSPPIVLPPTTPGTSLFPSPPYDPNSPPGGTCDYWRNHPAIIWGLFGFWSPTIGSAFGPTSDPGTGSHLNLLQALSNTRTDGIGALYREGTASLLNSMVNKNFPYTTSHVKDSFVAAIGSNKAAAAQARVFKLANEGHMKRRV